MSGQFDVYADALVNTASSFILTIAGESSLVTVEPTDHETRESRLISRVVLPVGESGLSLVTQRQVVEPNTASIYKVKASGDVRR